MTSNENKAREAARILGVELDHAGPEIPEIQSLDIAEVAAAKALSARDALREPPRLVVVEDSGLVVETWGGLPGAFTKWFLAGVGVDGLLRMLHGWEDRTARAVCVVAIADTDGQVRTFTGEVRGSIARKARGSNGFGWDPIFIPEGQKLTYAEMGDAKHEDSHRARAFRAAGQWLVGSAGSS